MMHVTQFTWRPALVIGVVASMIIVGPLTSCDRESSQSPGSVTPASVTNAADEYRSLHAAMGPQLIASLGQSSGALSPEVNRLLPSAQPVVDRLVWATRLERCDWGIDYSLGVDTELPHLPKLRELARLLRAHAWAAARAGDMGTAAEDVAAIVRLSRHVGGKSLIEVIVAYAILGTAMQLVTDHVEAWSPSQRRVMLAEFEQIDQRDPFSGETNLAWERDLAARARLQAPPDEQVFQQARQKTINELLVVLRVLGER